MCALIDFLFPFRTGNRIYRFPLQFECRSLNRLKTEEHPSSDRVNGAGLSLLSGELMVLDAQPGIFSVETYKHRDAYVSHVDTKC